MYFRYKQRTKTIQNRTTNKHLKIRWILYLPRNYSDGWSLFHYLWSIANKTLFYQILWIVFSFSDGLKWFQCFLSITTYRICSTAHKQNWNERQLLMRIDRSTQNESFREKKHEKSTSHTKLINIYAFCNAAGKQNLLVFVHSLEISSLFLLRCINIHNARNNNNFHMQ